MQKITWCHFGQSRRNERLKCAGNKGKAAHGFSSQQGLPIPAAFQLKCSDSRFQLLTALLSASHSYFHVK